MPKIFDVILVSVSRLLFSSPAFVKMAGKSLSGARRVQDSSGAMCSSHASGSSLLDHPFREVPVSGKAHESPPLLEAVATRLSSHATERPNLEDLGHSPTFNELSGITPSPTTLSSGSATGGDTSSSLGVNTSPSPIVAESHYPPSDPDDDMILALNSFSLSLVSDISESVDDQLNVSGSLDTLSPSTSPPCPTVTSTSKFLSHGPGLGISGLTRKDGTGPFDGLGIVSIKSSPWRHDDLPRSETLQLGDGIDQSDSIQGFNRRHPSSFSSSTYDSSLESDDFDPSLFIGTGDTGISDVFLQETLLTFTQDPFHQLCHSNVFGSTSIPDYDDNNSNSWSELGLGDESASTSTSMSESLVNDTAYPANDDSRPRMMMNYRRRIPELNTNFSSATISSELKRSSTTVLPKSNWRTRSSSWPSSTTEDTAAATPLPRCKWRL